MVRIVVHLNHEFVVPMVLATPDAHVAFTTWHFSRTDEEPMLSKRPEDPPICAYLMDYNFPYNVSSQWDPDDSSCVTALKEGCATALGGVYAADNYDPSNAMLSLSEEDACAGVLSGGPAKSHYAQIKGYCMASSIQ